MCFQHRSVRLLVYCWLLLAIAVIGTLFAILPSPTSAMRDYRKLDLYWARDDIPYTVVFQRGIANLRQGAYMKAINDAVAAWNTVGISHRLYRFVSTSREASVLTIQVGNYENQSILGSIITNPSSQVRTDTHWEKFISATLRLNVPTMSDLCRGRTGSLLWPEKNLQMLVLHELLHVLGLDDRYKTDNNLYQFYPSNPDHPFVLNHPFVFNETNGTDASVMTNRTINGVKQPLLFSTPQPDDIAGVTAIWNYYKSQH